MIVEKYNKDNLPYYFSMVYKIKYKDEKKHEDETEILPDDPLFVRKSFSHEEPMFEKLDLKDDLRLMILPHINRKGEEQRSCVYICGASGSGKSYLVNKYAELYYDLNKEKNKVFYFTLNNVDKDRSLSKSLYKIINVEKFIEHYSDEEEMNKFIKDSPEYDNSLLIMDDIGAIHDKADAKVMWDFINVILENKRKNNISIVVISHISTDYRRTALIIRETSQYIVYPQNIQVRSDRLMKSYLGLSKPQLDYIINLKNSLWCCIDCKRRLMITQREITPL